MLRVIRNFIFNVSWKEARLVMGGRGGGGEGEGSGNTLFLDLKATQSLGRGLDFLVDSPLSPPL